MQARSEQRLEKQHLTPRNHPWLCRGSNSPGSAGWLPAKPVESGACPAALVQTKSHPVKIPLLPSQAARAKTRMSTQNKKCPKPLAPKLWSSRELFQQKRKSSSHLSVLRHLNQKAARGIVSSKETPGRPETASASHHPTRAINNTTQQTQQDRARVVIATTSCIYISPFIRVDSREGRQAGLKSKRRKAASPLEMLVEPNPMVSSGSPSPELAARGRHSALAWPRLRRPRISCYRHCITHRFRKHLTYFVHTLPWPLLSGK